MSDQQLSISFALQDSVIDPYWINMEIVKEDDEEGMSVSEAASLIDSLYEIKSCTSTADVYNVDNTNETDNDPTPDEFTGTLEQLGISLDACEAALYDAQGDAGGYDVDIKVFRSHPNTEIYKLRISNGTASTPRKVTETVTKLIEVESATYVTTDNPIMGNAIITWAGFDGPELHIKGNTIWWEGETSGVLNAEFDTEYDLVHIHVTGEFEHSTIVEGTLPAQYTGDGWYSGTEEATEITGEQTIKCSVLAFYHYQYSELILEEPEEQDSVDSETEDAICDALNGDNTPYFGGGTDVDGDGIGGQDPYTPYDGDCFDWCMKTDCQGLDVVELAACRADCIEECTKWCEQSQDVTEICDCSHKETTVEITRRLKCPSDYEDGDTLPDQIPEVSYIQCNDTDEDVNDEEFYEETCCVSWPFEGELPRCQKIYSKYNGSGDFEGFEDNDKSDYDEYENVSFVGVSPKDGICGEKIVEQIVNQKNCCEDAPELYLHPEDNPSVIADNSSAMVIASGGTSLYTWSVTGEGAYFLLGGQKVNKVTTDARSGILYTDDACGSIKVSISDSCGKNATIAIRAGDGVWVTKVLRQWQPEYGANMGADVSCDPDLGELDPIDYGEELELYDTATDYSGWTRVVIQGEVRFTESGSYTGWGGLEGSSISSCVLNSCGSRVADEPWPPCAGLPAFAKYDCDKLVEDAPACLWYVDGPCCWECDDEVLLWQERWLVSGDCTYAVHSQMLFVRLRRWEGWEC